MTLRFYIHTIAKRAEAIALVDSRATKNFMNLTYARWLKLPIRSLEKPRKIFNVDGTENKSRELKYYTDLEVQTGTTRSPLHFFLTDLGENKAILGYSWFAATQPKIDWRRGWIDSSQLPVIFRAPDAKRARFTPRTVNKLHPITKDRYFIGKVTVGEATTVEEPNIPVQYQQHAKIFSEQESQRLPKHTVWDHAIKLLLGAPSTLPGRLLPLTQEEIAEAKKFVEEHLR